MDDPAMELGSSLKFQCPRCGHMACDEYEVIDAGTPVDWRCGGCRRLFSVLICECERCASEAVTVALSAAEQPRLHEIVCPQCRRPCTQDEEHDESHLVD